MPGRNEFDIALIQIETITEAGFRIECFLDGAVRDSQSESDIQFENFSKWSQTMRPICLPKGDEKFENGNMCMVAGWGATETASVSRFVSIEGQD